MTANAAPMPSGTLEAMFERAFAGSRDATRSASWVQSARQAAMQAFVKLGLPHRKLEAWKYTDLRKVLRDDYALTTARTGVAAHDGAEIMMLSEAMVEPGLWLRTLFEPAKDAIANLNTAFADEGALIRVPAQAHLAEPVMIHHDGPDAGAMSHARSLIQLEPGAQAVLIETVKADDAGFATSHLRIDVQEGAKLIHFRVMETGAGAIWLNDDVVTVDARADYTMTTVQGGSGLIRHAPQINLVGEGAAAHLSGASVGAGAGHIDWRLLLTHQAADTVSRLRARTVLGGESFGAVQGGVAVAQAAQKSDSHQLAKALLLSDRAQSVHKPELEIFADDVKCGHGAATGALSSDQLFYLRARGIPHDEARMMLVAAFVGEIADGNGDEKVAALLEGALRRLLGAAVGGRP